MSKETSFKNAIGQVKLAYNIVDYIQQSGIQLKRAGGTKYKGLCPFHNERTPSFTVDEGFQNFYCFGCAAKGDIFAFVSKTENLEFVEALRKLADDKGIELKLQANESGIDYKSLRAIVKATALFYHKEFKKLSPDHPAMQQIIDRGLTADKMVYGYAPEKRKALLEHLVSAGFSEELAHQAGVIGKNRETGQYFDFWSGRLMFIISDVTGNPIAFSGRKLYDTDQRGKYVNSPETPLFDKSAALFHLSRSKKQAAEEKRMYVAEGQFDVAAFVEAGLSNAVASSGTAFTEKQATAIRRLITENGEIVFCFDGDKAGIKASIRVFQNIPIIHSQAYAVSFPDGTDPSDYRQEHGNEAFKNYVETNKIPLIEFVIQKATLDYDMNIPGQRAQFVEYSARVLKTISNNVLRDAYVKKVALEAFTPVDAVLAALDKAKPLDSDFVKNIEEEKEIVSTTQFILENETQEDIEEESQIPDEDIISFIENEDDVTPEYSLAARVIAISMLHRRYTVALAKNMELIPDALKLFAKEVVLNAQQPNYIPELFTQTVLASYMTSKEFFPWGPLMTDEEYRSHFIFMFKELRRLDTERKKDFIQGKIASILDKTASDDTTIIKKALEKEKKELEKLGIKED